MAIKINPWGGGKAVAKRMEMGESGNDADIVDRHLIDILVVSETTVKRFPKIGREN